MKGIFTNNSSWQASQSVVHATVTFYGDRVKMYLDFAPNFGDKVTGFCITTTHRLTLPLSQSNFLPKTTLLSSPTHPELKGRHLNTTEVIEAESQAVLNTLTEHDFQDAFKNDNRWERCTLTEGATGG
jgi:hypothetical protein